MSQYLSFTFKYTKKMDITFSETYYCTTPARTLDAEGIFPYTEKEVEVDEEMIKEYIEIAKDEMAVTEGQLDYYKQEVEKYRDMLFKCESTVAYDKIKEDMAEMESMAKYNEDCIDEWKYYISHFEHLCELLKLNKEYWKLYYTNC